MFLEKIARAKRGNDGNGLMKRLYVDIETWAWKDHYVRRTDSRRISLACKAFNVYQPCFGYLTVAIMDTQMCFHHTYNHMKMLGSLGQLHSSATICYMSRCEVADQVRWCTLQPVPVRPLTLISMELSNLLNGLKYLDKDKENQKKESEVKKALREPFLSAAKALNVKDFCVNAEAVIRYVMVMTFKGKSKLIWGLAQSDWKALGAELYDMKDLENGSCQRAWWSRCEVKDSAGEAQSKGAVV